MQVIYTEWFQALIQIFPFFRRGNLRKKFFVLKLKVGRMLQMYITVQEKLKKRI